MAEHKVKINNGFTYRYNCDKLVYFEVYDSIMDAIRREKQLKNWKRAWKDELINTTNPEWKELSMEIGVDDAFIQELIADQVRNDGGINSAMTGRINSAMTGRINSAMTGRIKSAMTGRFDFDHP